MTIRHRAFILIAQDSPDARFTEYHLTHRRAAASQEGDVPSFHLPAVGAPYPVSSLPALEAACWVRETLPDRFPAFDLALYRAFFWDTRDVGELEVLMAVATEALGEAPVALREALRAGAMRPTVVAEHREAVERWHVRGIPAVMVGEGQPIVGAVPRAYYRAAVLAALGEPVADPSEPPSGRILQSGTVYFP